VHNFKQVLLEKTAGPQPSWGICKQVLTHDLVDPMASASLSHFCALSNISARNDELEALKKNLHRYC
jgi:hypothetical protein